LRSDSGHSQEGSSSMRQPPHPLHHLDATGEGAIILNYHQNPRTPRTGRRPSLAKLGSLEYLILEYAVKVAESFTPSDIVVYAREKYSMSLDRRRVHDAIQRLVRRNVVVKVKRGWYRLADSVDLPPEDIKLKKHRENLLDHVLQSRRNKNADPKDNRLRALVGVVGCGVVGGGVVRVHGVAGGLVEYFFQVAFSYYVLGVLLRGLEGYLRGLGYSRGFVGGVRGLARRFALSVVSGCECVVGGHGRFGSRGRGLKPLGVFERLYEVGVDFLVHGELPKIHLKIYTAESPYLKPQTVPLTAWCVRR